MKVVKQALRQNREQWFKSHISRELKLRYILYNPIYQNKFSYDEVPL